MIDISIIEDDEEIRQSLSILINGTPGFRCLSSFSNCEKALKQIETDLPDVVLMDLNLPGMSGIDGIRIIKELIPDLDILVLTVDKNSQRVFEALCAGACGYLTKDTHPGRLLEAIHEVHQGGAPMSTQIARMVVESFKTNNQSDLTRREQEVLTH